MEKKKRLIIIGGSIFVLSLTLGISLNLRNKPQNIKLEDLQKNKAIAFYKLKEDGTYEETNIMPTTGYKLNEEKSVCSNGAKPSLNTSDYSLNLTNLKGSTSCYLYFDKQTIPPAIETIIGDTTGIEEKTEFTGVATAADTGIYKAEDDYGPSYYFRGLEGSLNNWVKFAGSYWRIIRINGNGTIRMIYQGAANGAVSNSNKTGTTTQIGTSMYNHTTNDNAYVGYMMGIELNGTAQTGNETSRHSTSYEQAHTNTYDSDAKQQIDTWYQNNIANKTEYSKHIDLNTGFCSDRQVDKTVHTSYPGDGYGIQNSGYAPFGRVYQNGSWKSTQTPTLQCANKSRDLFTTNTSNESNKGNKALTYPVGMITMDEVIFAGGFYLTNNTTYYLYTNQTYWTMSPSHYYGSLASMLFVYLSGELDNNGVNITKGLRPVINLKADTKFTYTSESTKGSETDPFIVE